MMCNPNVMPERVDFISGDTIDQYIVERKIGSGSFGDVYKVKDQISNQTFALKVLKLWTTDKKTRENLNKRFELEFETGKIESPYLVQSVAYGCTKGNPFIVMEYCQGGTLRDQISYPLSAEVIQRYATEMLLGLRALHLNGKTHRDLKPDNVIFDAQMRAKLTDFGITGHANVKIKLTETDWRGRPKDQMGTWLYMPFEQLSPRNRKETILPTIDIFAFGVIAYEMFTGHLPFGGLTQENLDRDIANLIRRVSKGEWDHPSAYRVSIPSLWEEILKNCLAPDYKRRFQNVDAILQLLGTRVTPAPTAPVNPDAGIGLLVMQGEDYGKLYNLGEMFGGRRQGILKIGRYDPSGAFRNDVAIKEEQSSYISRMHATVERTPSGWYLRDGQFGGSDARWNASLNGTYVNGIEVATDSSTALKENDIITMGNTTLKVVRC
jgi:serine/threonine protein kinase